MNELKIRGLNDFTLDISNLTEAIGNSINHIRESATRKIRITGFNPCELGGLKTLKRRLNAIPRI
jgi:hypothetical protein